MVGLRLPSELSEGLTSVKRVQKSAMTSTAIIHCPTNQKRFWRDLADRDAQRPTHHVLLFLTVRNDNRKRGRFNAGRVVRRDNGVCEEIGDYSPSGHTVVPAQCVRRNLAVFPHFFQLRLIVRAASLAVHVDIDVHGMSFCPGTPKFSSRSEAVLAVSPFQKPYRNGCRPMAVRSNFRHSPHLSSRERTTSGSVSPLALHRRIYRPRTGLTRRQLPLDEQKSRVERTRHDLRRDGISNRWRDLISVGSFLPCCSDILRLPTLLGCGRIFTGSTQRQTPPKRPRQGSGEIAVARI